MMNRHSDKAYHLTLKSAFERLCDLAPECREQALRSYCGDNARLRSDLEQLLAADSGSESLVVVSPDVDSFVRCGDSPGFSCGLPAIPGYRVCREIGRGGMAIVYLAEQEHPRREVALKVIRPALVNERMIRRFSVEVDALARLQHVGIARILEAGVFHRSDDREPQPYFAMELVRGEAITDYCANQSVEQSTIVELFARVCDAVQHAHMRGVIHRDLKPTNILVTPDGEAKVLDFGVARMTDPGIDQSCNTLVDQLVGTPQYMSPEQCSEVPREVDSRSDIYALGLVLYELLAGAPAFDVEQRSLLEVLRIVRTTDPVPLGRHGKHLRGDLESIVSRAIARDPAERYSAASDLASDVRRYLRQEPVLARPLSRRRLLALAAKRNRGLVAAITVALACTSIGGAAAATAWRRATRASEQSEQLSDVLASALSVRGLSHDGRELTFQTVLNRAERRLAEIKDPLTHGRMCTVIGTAYMDLEVWDRAEPLLAQATADLGTALGGQHTLVFDSRELQLRARSQLHLRDRSVALQTVEGLDELLDDRERFEGPLTRGSLATRLALAEAVGSRYLVPARLADASVMLGELEPILAGTLGESDPLLVRALRSHAAIESWQYERVLASKLNDQALAILERSGSAEELDLLTCMQMKANLLRLRGLNKAAGECYDRVIERADRILPADSYIRWQLRHYRGRLLTTTGRFAEAEEDLRIALNGMSKFSNRGSTGDCLSALVELLITVGRFEDALDPMERFWTDGGLAPGTVENAWQAELGVELAIVYAESGRRPEALAVLDNIDDYEKTAGLKEFNQDTRAFRRAVTCRIRSGSSEGRLSAIGDYYRASFGRSGITPVSSAWLAVVMRWMISEYVSIGDRASADSWTRELALLPLRIKTGRNLLASGNLPEAGAYLKDRASDLFADSEAPAFAKADLAVVLDSYARRTGEGVPGAEFLSGWVPPPVNIDE